MFSEDPLGRKGIFVLDLDTMQWRKSPLTAWYLFHAEPQASCLISNKPSIEGSPLSFLSFCCMSVHLISAMGVILLHGSFHSLGSSLEVIQLSKSLVAVPLDAL